MPSKCIVVCVTDDQLLTVYANRPECFVRHHIEPSLFEKFDNTFEVSEMAVGGRPLPLPRPKRVEHENGLAAYEYEFDLAAFTEERIRKTYIDISFNFLRVTADGQTINAVQTVYRNCTSAEYEFYVDPQIEPKRVTSYSAGILPFESNVFPRQGPLHPSSEMSLIAGAIRVSCPFAIQRKSTIVFSVDLC
ncbi:hypothetical protein [Methylobacterium radiodurans]|uniref:Uncharacterized protein n=1 Tax=Methylobacterium radiodurans TaxID=2202828 RepID=A0A2U8VNT7_9HYPH|nr:hypothetical protein [Methylobacterium radiodurans]AWN35359.1 hypothetical protein DK427_06105 [Methylobacterium radiodurans]